MNSFSAFNMVEVWHTSRRHKKLIIGFSLLVAILTTLLVFFILPKYYRSEAVVVATNPALADKSRLLNNQVQHLYTPYGDGDDLAMLYAIADLDTVYLQLVDELKLVDFYDLSGSRGASQKAALALRDAIKLEKTENDALSIKTSTRDRHLSANITNRMVEIISAISERSWLQAYTSSLKALQQMVDTEEAELQAVNELLKGAGETSQIALLSRRAALVEQLQQLYKASKEYELAIASKPASLVVVQNAFPAQIEHTPKKLQTIIIALFASLAFAVVAASVYDAKTGR